MSSSPAQAGLQGLFGPTEDDRTFLAEYCIFLGDVTKGGSSRADASKCVENMLPYLHHESSTVYRRAVCRIAIAFIARLYKFKQYTHADLATLAQECVELLESTKPKCGPEYYENRFARLERFAITLRDWHAKKAVVFSVADPSPNPTEGGDVERMEKEEADELEEAMELLKRHTI